MRSAKYGAILLGIIVIYSGFYYLRIWRGITFGAADGAVLAMTKPAEELRRWYFVDLPFRRKITGDWISDEGHHLAITREGRITFELGDYGHEVVAKLDKCSPWAGYHLTGLTGRFDHGGARYTIQVIIQEDDFTIPQDQVIVSRLDGGNLGPVFRSYIQKVSAVNP